MKKQDRELKFMIASNQLDAAIAAGYSLSDARAAGYSLSDARAAGYSLSDARAAGYSDQDSKEWDSIPVLEKPYTKLWNDIKEKKRIHKQSTFGDIETFEEACKLENQICNTQMCTAGHRFADCRRWRNRSTKLDIKTNVKPKHNSSFQHYTATFGNVLLYAVFLHKLK